MAFEDVLKKAWADVSAAQVPEHLQEIAFAEAIRHHSGAAPVAVATVAAASPPTAQSQAAPAATAKIGSSGTDLLQVLSQETSVDRDWINEMFYLDDEGQPQISLPARRLGANTAARMRTIAVALCAARHYGLDEMEFSLDMVRDTCVSLNAYDSANFTAQLGKTAGLTLSGPPRGKKTLRAKSDLDKAFAATMASVFASKGGE